MSIYSNTPYTYRIRWTKTGMNYYGVRFAKNCRPSDLFVTYFTSSVYVADYIKKHGLPDVIEIRKTFNDEDGIQRAIVHEHRVLKKLRATKRDDYLNKTDNKSINLDDPEIERRRKKNAAIAVGRPSVRKKLSDAAHKQWSDPEIRKLMTQRQREVAFSPNRVLTRNKQVGLNSSNVDKTVYTFTHLDGRIEVCTRLELKQKYSLNDGNLCSVIKGNRKRHRGWSIN